MYLLAAQWSLLW